MPLKKSVPNLGIPLFIDPRADLAAKPDTTVDSWYVLCSFPVAERQLAFVWHQMLVGPPNGQKMVTNEFLLTDAKAGVFVDRTQQTPASDSTNASADRCHVISSLGALSGDHERLTLKLEMPDGAVDVVLRPKEQVLYNGTTGVLPLMGTRSFEYAFPNMEVDGTILLKDETIEVHGATAWLDRQWSYPASDPNALTGVAAFPSWLWLGMPLTADATTAISLWDINENNGDRFAFATILDERGVQTNHVAELEYVELWKSDATGHSYPRRFNLSIPTADLALYFDLLLQRGEFVHGNGGNLSGCESPYAVRGNYGSHRIDKVAIVEMIGDVCGEQ